MAYTQDDIRIALSPHYPINEPNYPIYEPTETRTTVTPQPEQNDIFQRPSALRRFLTSAGSSIGQTAQDPRFAQGISAVLSGASDPIGNVGQGEKATQRFLGQQEVQRAAAGEFAANRELEQIRNAALNDRLEKEIKSREDIALMRENRADMRSVKQPETTELGRPVEVGGIVYEQRINPETGNIEYIQTREASTKTEGSEGKLIGPAKWSKEQGQGFNNLSDFKQYLDETYKTTSISKALKKAQESEGKIEYNILVREAENWTGVPLIVIDKTVSKGVDELRSGNVSDERAKKILDNIDTMLADVGGDIELLTPNTQEKLMEYYDYVESLSKLPPEKTGAREAGKATRNIVGGVSQNLINMLKETNAYKGGKALVEGGKAASEFGSGLVTGE